MTSDWGTRTQNQSLSPDDSLLGFPLASYILTRACRQVWPQRLASKLIMTPHPAFTWSCLLNAAVLGESQEERASVTFTWRSWGCRRAGCLSQKELRTIAALVSQTPLISQAGRLPAWSWLGECTVEGTPGNVSREGAGRASPFWL